MISVSKNVYIDTLADIVNKYKLHSTIKMKPFDVNASTYIDYGVENNEKHLQSKAVTISRM